MDTRFDLITRAHAVSSVLSQRAALLTSPQPIGVDATLWFHRRVFQSSTFLRPEQRQSSTELAVEVRCTPVRLHTGAATGSKHTKHTIL